MVPRILASLPPAKRMKAQRALRSICVLEVLRGRVEANGKHVLALSFALVSHYSSMNCDSYPNWVGITPIKDP